MILNQAQAEAVYSAMCALNNVGGRLSTQLPPPVGSNTWIHIEDHFEGFGVLIRHGMGTAGKRESYDNQSAFATAYGLQQG